MSIRKRLSPEKARKRRLRGLKRMRAGVEHGRIITVEGHEPNRPALIRVLDLLIAANHSSPSSEKEKGNE